jgi:hypothetical protein
VVTGPGRRAVALALRDAGVLFPPAVSLESFGAGPLTAWAEGRVEAWTIVLAGGLPDLAAFGVPVPAAGSTASLGGPSPLLAPLGGTVPPASVAHQVGAGATAVVAIGPDAEIAAKAAVATLGSTASAPAASAPHVLAWFRLPRDVAARLLGPAVEPGGLLPPLGGGDLEGTLSTDGARAILEVRRTAR